jgi:hypothetical protein
MTEIIFEIKPEHLKLLKHFYVDWDDCEFGAPEIDPKRPYGNSNVYQNMIEILGLKKIKDGIYKITLDDTEWLLKGEDMYNLYLEGADETTLIKKLHALHKDLKTVLQICLATQKFETGKFEVEKYNIDWKKI